MRNDRQDAHCVILTIGRIARMDMLEWIEADKLPAGTSFLCPHCREKVYFSHESSSKSRKHGVDKRCLYRFCPWCGEPVTPLRINYIADGRKRDE
jgi:hypothetical protein